MINPLNFAEPLVFNTSTGMKTTVRRTVHPADRPPLTLQSGQAWHYTSLQALQNILRGQQLWATSWRKTNDRTEFRHGIDFLHWAWRRAGSEKSLAKRTLDLLAEAGPFTEYPSHFEEVNIFCMARERDSPYQWNSYAPGPEGVAIGIDLSIDLVTDVDDRPRRSADAKLFGIQWLKVVYTERQKQLVADRCVKEIDEHVRQNDDTNVSTFVMLNILTALNFKHSGFRHEKEVRCVTVSDGVTLDAIPGMPEKTIVPWVGLPVEPRPLAAGRHPLPIVEILLGPRVAAPVVEAVISSLADAGMSDVPVWSSELPFR